MEEGGPPPYVMAAIVGCPSTLVAILAGEDDDMCRLFITVVLAAVSSAQAMATTCTTKLTLESAYKAADLVFVADAAQRDGNSKTLAVREKLKGDPADSLVAYENISFAYKFLPGKRYIVFAVGAQQTTLANVDHCGGTRIFNQEDLVQLREVSGRIAETVRPTVRPTRKNKPN
jgi:hypothetical protein